jgi:uncharacterized DUF497 family protein
MVTFVPPVSFTVKTTVRYFHTIGGFMLEIDWDDNKRLSNIERHGIDFAEVYSIFDNPYLDQEDTRKDYGEKRIKVIGLIKNVVCVIIYTPRDTTIRVISARRANERERKYYQSAISSSGTTGQP